MTILIEQRDPDPDDVTYTVECFDCDEGGQTSDAERAERWVAKHEDQGHTVTRGEIRWVT